MCWIVCCRTRFTSIHLIDFIAGRDVVSYSPAGAHGSRMFFICRSDSKTFGSKSSKILFKLHYANPPLTCHGQPPTPAAPLCTNHVSFEVPVIASSWPDIDLHTPVHLSLIHPPRPRLRVRARRLPVPSRAAAWQAANRAWQVARQCHGLTAESTACLHSFPPLCPLTWTPPLQTPARSTRLPAGATSSQTRRFSFFFFFFYSQVV